jgi:hypothetical protein
LSSYITINLFDTCYSATVTPSSLYNPIIFYVVKEVKDYVEFTDFTVTDSNGLTNVSCGSISYVMTPLNATTISNKIFTHTTGSSK